MKIVFICGSMEPGRDGVGDYIRRLAGELQHRDITVAVLAYNDRNINALFNGVQLSAGNEFPVRRLPAVMDPKKRFQQAQDFITQQNPDWLSLQYVPFAFHQKGLHFGLAKQLTQLGKGKKWHLMFHELWVGMDTASPAKHKAWGWLQKQLMLLLAKILKPKAITTQTKLYQAYLSKAGFNVQYLPLFGNIPVKENTGGKANNTITLVIFGNIHDGAPVQQFAKEVAAYALVNNLQAELKMIGRCGNGQQAWIDAWKALGMQVTVSGEQSTEEISAALSSAAVGIATTPMALVGKSGSVAAMLNHGLPVICVARKWQPRNISNVEADGGVLEYQPGNFARLFVAPVTKTMGNTDIENIAGRLINILNGL